MRSAPETAPAPYRRPWAGPLTEWVLLVCLAAAGGATFLAQRGVDVSSEPLRHVRTFYRDNLVGVVKFHGDQVLPLSLLCLAVAALLVVLALVPRVRPEVRGAAAAYGFVLLLAPVLNYAPQVELLGLFPEDVKILSEALPADVQALLRPDTFDPVLPVTWPLLLAVVALAIWVLVTPAAARPTPATAFGLVGLLLVGGGYALVRTLLVARGNALDFAYTQWPSLIASLWLIGQLAVAATAAAAAARDPLRSRLTAGLAAGLLLLTALVSGGRP